MSDPASDPAILVAIPSLQGGALLEACLRSLGRQTTRDFEVIVVDNSGTGAIADALAGRFPELRLHIFRSTQNLGFAAGINQAWSMSEARFLATLNDDAEVQPEWLEALRGAMEESADIGMCASRVRLFGTGDLDSAGMLAFWDGSSKQRGQGRPEAEFGRRDRVLFPSASAALYRREMLDDVGLFDADFFLYCEDADLGLRARWNGWDCVYVPEAVVDHHYSQSAGSASAFKAWHIERNRLWVAAKNYPMRLLVTTPWHSALRYFWHLVYMLRGRGAAAQFRAGGSGAGEILSIVLRAHWTVVTQWPELRRKRRAIRKGALISDKQFIALLKRHSISAREIARL